MLAEGGDPASESRRGDIQFLLDHHAGPQAARADRPLDHGAKQPALLGVRADVLVRNPRRINDAAHDDPDAAHAMAGGAVPRDLPRD